VVDDDPSVRTLLNLLLQEDGYAVWLTADGYQALKAYRGNRQDIDLVLMDVRMPGLDGPQTLTALREDDPQLCCCFMTGDPGAYTEQDLLDRGARQILYKPFRLSELRQVLQRVMPSPDRSRPK
jgi:CheY-like chemotaxis protein